MRITREKSEQKQNFVLSLFAVTPKMTVREVQEKLKETFGATMNPSRILSLRASLSPPVEAPAVEAVEATKSELMESMETEVVTPGVEELQSHQ